MTSQRSSIPTVTLATRALMPLHHPNSEQKEKSATIMPAATPACCPVNLSTVKRPARFPGRTQHLHFTPYTIHPTPYALRPTHYAHTHYAKHHQMADAGPDPDQGMVLSIQSSRLFTVHGQRTTEVPQLGAAISLRSCGLLQKKEG